MKRVFITLSLIFCINILSYSQIIRESIPEFAEKLLTLNKASAESNIVNRGFDVLPPRTLISLGYDEDSLGNLIVGIGDRKIICEIQADVTGRNIKKVTVGGVRYLNAKYMINEYQSEGYVLDEENSTRSELIFVKQTDKYNYFAFVEFMINPYMCMSNTEFRRVSQKEQSYIEQSVDLNDYFNSKTGWDDNTDWNATGIEDEELYIAFNKRLKKNGIYWSDKKKSWVKKVAVAK